MSITVYRKSHFNAAHRLYRPDWDDQKNNDVFGKCNNPNFHGHNYALEVGITGEVDPETGYLIDIKKLKTIMKEEVEDYLSIFREKKRTGRKNKRKKKRKLEIIKIKLALRSIRL